MSKILEQVSATTAKQIFDKCLNHRAQLLYLRNLGIIESLVDKGLKYYEFTARSISQRFNWFWEEDTTINVDDLEFPAETILEFMLGEEPSDQQSYNNIENSYQLLNQFVVVYYQNELQSLSTKLSPEATEFIKIIKIAIPTWTNSTFIENNLDISSNSEITSESQSELDEEFQEKNIQLNIETLEQEFFESEENLARLAKKHNEKSDLTLLTVKDIINQTVKNADEKSRKQLDAEVHQELISYVKRKKAQTKRVADKERKEQERAQKILNEIKQKQEAERKAAELHAKILENNFETSILNAAGGLFVEPEVESKRMKAYLRFSKVNIKVDGQDEFLPEPMTTGVASFQDELDALEKLSVNTVSAQTVVDNKLSVDEMVAHETIILQQELEPKVAALNDNANEEILEDDIFSAVHELFVEPKLKLKHTNHLNFSNVAPDFQTEPKKSEKQPAKVTSNRVVVSNEIWINEKFIGNTTALMHKRLSKEPIKTVSNENLIFKLLHEDYSDRPLLNLTRERLNDALKNTSFDGEEKDENKLIAQLKALQEAFEFIKENKNDEYPEPDMFYMGSNNSNLHDIQLKHITLLKSAAATISTQLVQQYKMKPEELLGYAGELIKFNVTRFKIFTKQEGNWFLSEKTKTERTIWKVARESAEIAEPVVITNRTALTA